MENPLKIKEDLYSQCLDVINSRFQTIQNTINEIQVSLTSETKSSAGDKHETGRAMLQLEREKAGNQLAEIQKIKEILFKIDISKTLKVIGLGSAVYTSQSNYFIAISVGELTIDGVRFYAISPSTPIGQLLIGKRVGEEVVFREQKFIINQIS
ncbi:3-oxoacyl-ACP synthase [Flavivirga sp. MEBiC05379]|uniref:GreA/GreB family elongation factor n=2 Tax=Flavivirga spongiicola TaxID=421621 RepID=A0ABU7XUD5_9FLAO|nr:3-oxoacyl-ACP synthase [Flavivirga sp. MEBiC05379]MDO5979039.1 3-oxoacyl-ACP synthase [Flavivirga sp. MEBiC05379]